MTNVRNISRRLKTRNEEAYAELSPNVGGQEEGEDYPFSTGFAVFSASLVVGYMNDDGELIEEEAERRFSDEEDSEETESGDSAETDSGSTDSEEEEDSYHPFIQMQKVIDNNKDHAYTIELIDRLIAIELASHSDDPDEDIPDDVWNLVVAHADKGVGIIRQQWKSNGKIELDDRFDELEDFWEGKINEVSDELTQIPTREDGRMQTGD
jgi:hypothetical protein